MDQLKQNLLDGYGLHKTKVHPAVHIHPGVVVLSYFTMLGLVTYFSVHYKEKATTGYAYSWVQPDGMTFSIWGIIYTLQFFFVMAQFFILHIRNDERVILARPGYIMQAFLSAFWLYANAEANLKGLSSFWLSALVLVSSVLFLYFGAFYYIAQDSNPYRAIAEVEEQGDKELKQVGGIFSSFRKLQYRWLVWYPISTNMAWIFLAGVLDVSSTILDVEYLKLQPTAIGGPDFAIGVAFLAALVAAFNGITKQDFGYCFVTMWALLGIYRNQHNSDSGFPHEQCSTLAEVSRLSIGLVAAGLVLGWILDAFGAIPSTRVELISEEKNQKKGKVTGSE